MCGTRFQHCFTRSHVFKHFRICSGLVEVVASNTDCDEETRLTCSLATLPQHRQRRQPLSKIPVHGGFGSGTQETGSVLKNALTRSANASGWVVSHSQIVSTFQPAVRRRPRLPGSLPAHPLVQSFTKTIWQNLLPSGGIHRPYNIALGVVVCD